MKYKIKSVSDVITNSSTEVFLLETTKPLEEVLEILPTITEGYLPPVILDSKEEGNPLEMVYSFGSIFYDDNDLIDFQLYVINLLLGYEEWKYDFYEIKIPEGLPELSSSLRNYFERRLSEISESIEEIYPYPSYHRPTNIYEVDKIGWDLQILAGNEKSRDKFPFWILNDFLDSLPTVPDYLKIPKELTVGYWEGKIGFSGEDDNSIPSETWEKIIEVFGGTHYHLG